MGVRTKEEQEYYNRLEAENAERELKEIKAEEKRMRK